jgi:hypothetical protein
MQMAYFFHQSVQTAYKVYLQVGTHIWSKQNAPLAQNIDHFWEAFKTHHGIDRDRSTGRLTTQTANFFHQLIEVAYIVYLQVGNHIWWKKKVPLAQKKGHFRETEKTHHGSHNDMSTRSFATQISNFFHQSIQTYYKVYLQVGTHLPWKKWQISTKNRSFLGGLQNSPLQPL